MILYCSYVVVDSAEIDVQNIFWHTDGGEYGYCAMSPLVLIEFVYSV